MPSREAFFECTYEAGRAEHRVQLRAWSAEEALVTLRHLLAGAGVEAPGTLKVADLRGRVLLRARYAPPERGADAAAS